MTVAVVGAGLAGLRTCEALRQQGYRDPILLVGAETHFPYSRPPLSKEVLRGDAEPAVATLRRPDELAALEVELLLGVEATGVDVAGRRLLLGDREVGYDDLVVATGATPRRLPGPSADGVHVLRTVDECLRLRDALRDRPRVVIVGAGFIGLEVAASARALGCPVTVVDVLPLPLARVLPPEVGAAVQRLHEERGVGFRLGVGVADVTGTPAVESVGLSDGSRLSAEVVVVGIGVVPQTRWLAGSGLTLGDGVECDETLRAAPGRVGGRRSRPLAGAGRRDGPARALDQRQRAGAGRRARGRHRLDRAVRPVPYFWSDQYDAKLQCLGYTDATAETLVVSGALEEPKWVALLRSGDRLAGVLGMRSPAGVMRLRSLLAAGASWDDAVAETR